MSEIGETELMTYVPSQIDIDVFSFLVLVFCGRFVGRGPVRMVVCAHGCVCA